MRLRVLHPGREAAIANDNANSIVLAVEYAGRRLLFTGDLESSGLADVVAVPGDLDDEHARAHDVLEGDQKAALAQ